MKKTTIEPFEHVIDRIVDEVKTAGCISSPDGRYSLGLSDESPWIVMVIDTQDQNEEGVGKVVAYSEMKGDFEPSLREFAEDYIA